MTKKYVKEITHIVKINKKIDTEELIKQEVTECEFYPELMGERTKCMYHFDNNTGEISISDGRGIRKISKQTLKEEVHKIAVEHETNIHFANKGVCRNSQEEDK